MLKCYTGLLCQGKSDYEAIEPFRAGDEFFPLAFDIKVLPSCETLRQRLDQLDVSPFDNSKTLKEGVSRTYKGYDGYAPIFAYLGAEGYLVNTELRPGKQHCQNGTRQAFVYPVRGT